MRKRLFLAGFVICMSAAYVAYFLSVKSPERQSKVEVNSDVFSRKQDLNSHLPVLIEFSAKWCVPCQLEAPIVEAASREWEGKVKFIMVDIDEDRMLATKFGISTIPTIVILKPKSEQGIAHTGFLNQAQLHSFIERSLSMKNSLE